jgi:ankyrin repeat protein
VINRRTLVTLAMILSIAACSGNQKFGADEVFPNGPARSLAHLIERNDLPPILKGGLLQAVNARGRYDLTPLLWAVKNDKVRPSTLGILVRNGADPFYYSPVQLASPLLHSLQYGSLDEFKAIVAATSNIDTVQYWSKDREPTLLFSAVSNRDLDKVKVVLFAGANLERRNGLGETPLLYANTGQLDILHYLLISGANPQVKDNKGNGVCSTIAGLHYATPGRQAELKQVQNDLLARGIKCL